MRYDSPDSVSLGEVASYVSDKVKIEDVYIEDYVSTENLMPDFGGLDLASGLPNTDKVNKFTKGDILISNIRPYFKKIWFADRNGGCSNDVLILRANSKIDNVYLYYSLACDQFFDYVMTGAKGTKMPRGDKKHILNYVMKLPSLEDQQYIAHTLSTMDEKIEVNNQINKTLEAMAQEIFKHWFVNFEFPNENGEPYKSSGGEMIESELGMIPKGWKIVSLAQIGSVITGKTPSTQQADNFGSMYNFITPRDLNIDIYILDTERRLSEVGANKLKSMRIKKNSIGVSCIGSNLGEVYINAEDGFTNQQINSLILNEEEIYPFVFIILKNMKEDFLNLAGGSAVPIINKTTFSAIKIIKPCDLVLNHFIKAVTKMFETIKINSIQNKYLSGLRDSLLPKLMSGEIEVHLDEDIEVLKNLDLHYRT